MHQSVLYLWLALPGIGSGKAMDVAGWFHGVIFSNSSKS
jgi:phage terminase large subunit-like protein